MGKLYDGLGGLTTTTGTGTYVVSGPIAGFIPFSSIADNELVDLVVRGPGNFREIGEYKKIGGASAQLQRIQIFATHADLDGGTAVNWAAGEKQIYSALSADSAVSRRFQNTWLDHQLFAGKRVVLSPDALSYIFSPANGYIDTVLDGAVVGRFQYVSTIPNLILKTSQGGAIAGPILRLERNNPTPAAGQAIGSIIFAGMDSGGNQVHYATDQTIITDAANGAEKGYRRFMIMDNGVEVEAASMGDSSFQINGTVYPQRYFLVNKADGSGVLPGMMIDGNQQMWVITSNGLPPLNVVKTAVAPQYMASFFYNTTFIGGVYATDNSTISYLPFTGAHPSSHDADFVLGVPLAELPVGTVVCSTSAMYNEGQPWLPKWRLPHGRADRSVYGVYAGIHTTPSNEEAPPVPNGDCINALGQWQVRVVGPVREGDLLITDGEAIGCACVQDDDLIRASTIGKCRRTDLGQEPRLVPATLMCG